MTREGQKVRGQFIVKQHRDHEVSDETEGKDHNAIVTNVYMMSAMSVITESPC